MSQDAVPVAEQAVLGSIMCDSRAMEIVADLLTVEDFLWTAHRTVYRAAQRLFERGLPVDALTVFHELGEPDIASQGLDLGYLGGLAAAVASPRHVRLYADLVRRASVLRCLAGIGRHLAQEADGGQADAPALIAEAEAALAVALGGHHDDAARIGDAMTTAIERIEERRAAGSHVAGLVTGMADLDVQLGGLEGGQLVVVAARPSVGKTAFALAIASGATADGLAVLFHSLEMPSQQIAQRVLALRSGISVARMRGGDLTDAEVRQLPIIRDQARDEKLLIDDRGSVTVGYVRARARRMQRQGGLDLVICDYIQLMAGSGQNRTQEIGNISRGLKALAKELAVPVIALAQLNRALEGRVDRRPLLADLRDSGEVEQDADVVVMLHREAMYGGGPEWHGLAEVLIRKHRNGPTGAVLMSFDNATGGFGRYVGPNPRMSGRDSGKAHFRGGFQPPASAQYRPYKDDES